MNQSDIKARFLDALYTMNKVEVIFFSKEDNKEIVRICAPMDFGPSKRAKDKSDRYHLWDYTSYVKGHTLSLFPSQIVSIELLSERFTPSEFVTWRPNWIVKRDWGIYS